MNIFFRAGIDTRSACLVLLSLVFSLIQLGRVRMLWRINATIVARRLLLTAFCIMSISMLPSASLTMAADGETVKVNDKANGSSVALQVGQFLEICLPADLGTGYSWTVSSTPNEILKLLAKDVRPTAEKNKVGGTDHQIFHFQIVAQGSGRLELQYSRPWEKATPPAKKYSLAIKVQ